MGEPHGLQHCASHTPGGSPGSAVLIYLPRTARLRMNGHPVGRAREPCDLGPVPSDDTVLGLSSPTRKRAHHPLVRHRAGHIALQELRGDAEDDAADQRGEGRRGHRVANDFDAQAGPQPVVGEADEQGAGC